MREGRIQKPEDVDAAVVEGASARVRPLVMTVATTVLGLLPLLWEAGVGADVSARTAAPVVGGLWSCMFLTLLQYQPRTPCGAATGCALAPQCRCLAMLQPDRAGACSMRRVSVQRITSMR